MNKNLKFVLHVLGLGCLFADAFFGVILLSAVMFYPNVVVAEPNGLLLAAELVLSIYALVYLAILTFEVFHNTKN